MRFEHVALVVACSVALTMIRMNVTLTRWLDMEALALPPMIPDSPANDYVFCKHETIGPCCAGWDVDMDEWWLHRPDWDISSMNDSMCCFSRFNNPERVEFLKRVHQVQWHGNCSAVRASPIISSGFGADVGVVARSFYSAVADHVPYHVTKHWEGAKWHYAASNNHSVCESADMLCYFLPITNCKSQIGQNDRQTHSRGWSELEMESLWAYLIRPQQWLRRRIYDYIASQFNSTELPTPCTAIHVRRTDAALDLRKRRYYRLDEYLNKSGTAEGANLLLLTDDRSTIEEAELLHPNYNWMYVNRMRFRGTESVFEDQMPSRDLVLEMVILLSEMKLAEQCNRMVHTNSGYAKFLIAAMRKFGSNMTELHINPYEKRTKLANRNEGRAIGDTFMSELDKDLAEARAAKAGGISSVLANRH